MNIPPVRIRLPGRSMAFVLPVVVVATLIGLGGRFEQKVEPRSRAAAAPAATAGLSTRAAGIEPALHRRGLSVGRGGTLSAAVDRLSVPDHLREPLLAALRVQIDARRLSPQTGIVVETDESGAWRRVAVRPQPQRFLDVEIHDGREPSARWVELPVNTEVRVVSGIVTDSVARALAGSPHGHLLTLAVADVFQWDVDLLVEPRPGDRIRVVYEIRELAKVPAHLPPFGSAASRTGELLGIGRILAASYSGRIASANAFWVEREDGSGDYFDLQGRPLRKTFLKSPLNYRRISSGFTMSRRNPVTRKVAPHPGVDFAAAAGTPVMAAADGRVVSTGWDGPLGRAVRIRHGSEYVTVYGHLRGVARGVRSGVDVRQNQLIGYVGSTGRATGPHLHYSVVHRGRPIDPLKLDNPPVEPLDPELLPSLALAVRRWRPMLDVDP